MVASVCKNNANFYAAAFENVKQSCKYYLGLLLFTKSM